MDGLKDIVEQTLRTDERARNSDTWLILQVLRYLGVKVYLDYKQLPELPAFESITRARRFIQNEENKFLPTDAEVIKQRKIKKEAYTQMFGKLKGEMLL